MATNKEFIISPFIFRKQTSVLSRQKRRLKHAHFICSLRNSYSLMLNAINFLVSKLFVKNSAITYCTVIEIMVFITKFTTKASCRL